MKRPATWLLLIAFFSFYTTEAQPKYEFRGVWIATVNNIDWPQSGMTDPEKQKADYIRLLDLHQQNGMNAMIVQVRPAADAFYPSQYEPWSQWLTGVQGKPPTPYYDPLQFMAEPIPGCSSYWPVFSCSQSYQPCSPRMVPYVW